MAIADGPGSLSWGDDLEAWLVSKERAAQDEEQGLLLVLMALCARDDVDLGRIDLALKVGRRE